MPLAIFEGANLNCPLKNFSYSLVSKRLSDQLVLQVLLNPLYVQLCFQPMYVATVTPEYFGCSGSADDPVVH